MQTTMSFIMTSLYLTSTLIVLCSIHLFIVLQLIIFGKDKDTEKKDRRNRSHANLITQQVTFWPLAIFISLSWGDIYGAGLLAVFLIANIIYAMGYVRSSEGRKYGAMIYMFLTMFTIAVTLGTIGLHLYPLALMYLG